MLNKFFTVQKRKHSSELCTLFERERNGKKDGFHLRFLIGVNRNNFRNKNMLGGTPPFRLS